MSRLENMCIAKVTIYTYKVGRALHNMYMYTVYMYVPPDDVIGPIMGVKQVGGMLIPLH